VHALADDLESFFHVLAWMALRYTDHAMPPNRLTSFMQSYFDECYAQDHGGGFGGGDNKASSLISRNIVQTPNFKNARLSALLSALCQTLAVRYETPPPADRVQAYETLNLKRTDMDDLGLAVLQYVEGSDVPQYLSRLKYLETSDWMLKIFTDAVEDEAGWLTDDKPVKHDLVVLVENGKKRKSDVSLDIFVPPVGKRRRLGNRNRRAITVAEEESSGDGDEELSQELEVDEDRDSNEEGSQELDDDEDQYSA
jgi:hypothetical protein